MNPLGSGDVPLGGDGVTFHSGMFTTDSLEYEILQRAVWEIKGVPGAIVEIGTREGGSAKLIIDTLVSEGDTRREMFCIDPYGDLDFPMANRAITRFNLEAELRGDPDSVHESVALKLGYDNSMRNKIVPALYWYAYRAGIDFTLFFLEDTEFFERYADGVPVYNDGKRLVNEYSFVFYDGPHTNEAVDRELAFFIPRTHVGSVAVFDDIWMMDHEGVAEEKWLLPNGWELIEKGEQKASYRKVS
ncbi:class I SAM-dependent methyltransferase [Mycolicibacterium sp.]|uniref:class I SAM-dependent methyltransferase n=1 Tax=Mycolicibacterium sp. TaxID=2320850 RepID=UPI0028B0EC49|nr:class I SAM-dependent methyltransferase [Mycolicibacterium sp.]